MTTVTLIPILEDNYAYILETTGGAVAVVDAGDSGPVIAYLDQHHLTPSYILNTHHHGDHVAGNAALREKYACPVLGAEKERAKIQTLTNGLKDGDIIKLGKKNIHVIETPGHTAGAICYYLPASGLLFTGDTLFSLGCGRIFDGTAQEYWESFQKICALPDETLIYCGHEYTQSNAAFCLSIEADNTDLRRRVEEVNILRAENKATLPVTLGLEKKTNVFLRAGSAERFKTLRALKDRF